MATVSLNPLAELYFHGRITREDAEELLRDGPSGKFLLRSREVFNTGLDIFIISVSFEGQVLHYSVDRRPDGSYNIPGGKQFIGPVEIVRHHMLSQDGIKVLLSQPVNRPPDLGAVVYWGLTTDIVEAELFQSGGLSREAAREEVYRIFANSASNKPLRFREFLRQMQYSRPWYHGVAGREEAEKRLAATGMRTGTFLIRHKKDCFVLSVIHDRQFKHYLIRERQTTVQNSGGTSSPRVGSPVSVCGYGMDGGPMYSSLIELVHWYHAYPDGLPCALFFLCSNTLGSEETPTEQQNGRVRSKPASKMISVVDETLPSHRVKSPPKPEQSTPPPPPTESAKADDELAKKLALELELSVAQPGQNLAPKTHDANKIMINVQRPAVAVRPTAVIPMCKPASTPVPSDSKEDEKPKVTTTKRVIRLPQSLARKTLATSEAASSRRHIDNLRSTSPFKPVQNAQSPRTTSPPTNKSLPRTTLIFDAVHTRVSQGSSPTKDDWDEPASGGDHPANAVAGPVNGHWDSKKTIPRNTPLHPEPLALQDSVMRLDPEWLEIHQTIGHGHFGTVLFGYLVTPQSRIPVAIKSVHDKESRCVDNVVKEATTMSNVTHPNIITFYGVCHINSILLVMEYAPLGTLQKFIRANRQFPMTRIVKLMIQVADAMRYLEKNKLVHRDLACRNVLLLSEDQAKVSDFGMSRALDVQRDYYKSQHVGKWPLKWYPPEAIYYWKFDAKTDVWSYGVTLWEATSYGARPYQGMDGWQVLKFIESGKRLDRPSPCPPQLYCLMNECWKFKSSERPTFEEVLVTMLDIDCQLAANVASSD